jgi:hypothetical protein
VPELAEIAHAWPPFKPLSSDHWLRTDPARGFVRPHSLATLVVIGRRELIVIRHVSRLGMRILAG